MGLAGAALGPVTALVGSALVIASLTWGSLMARNRSLRVTTQTISATVQSSEG
jgi:hypothetical protein